MKIQRRRAVVVKIGNLRIGGNNPVAIQSMVKVKTSHTAAVIRQLEALKLAGKRNFKIAFLLNPTRVSQVKAVAEHGERMPRKATFFYPKPLSGLVIRKI